MTSFVLENEGTPFSQYRCLQCRTANVTTRRREVKTILIGEAGGCCSVCGYDRCASALVFHHRDPRTKQFGIGEGGYVRSLVKARAEAEKCDLLCANCHAEVEAGLL